jgi:putative transposase
LHLMVIPEESASMANTFRHAHGRFAQYWNTEFRTSGHLWQNRYYSCAVEQRAVGCVMAYVENNPVRAGMTRRAENYVWSSARAHLSGTDVSGCLDMNWWRTSGMQPGWSDVLLNAGMRAEEFDAIRRATFAGRPLGSKEFVAGLERKLKRNLSAQPGGRPKHVREDGGRQMGLWQGWWNWRKHLVRPWFSSLVFAWFSVPGFPSSIATGTVNITPVPRPAPASTTLRAPSNGKKKTPWICGGTFGFGGLEVDAVEGGAFAGGIVETDSQKGTSGGLLEEAWLGGEGPFAGVGKITSPSDTSVLQGLFGFVGAGINAGPLAGVQVGFVSGKGWGGLYIEGHAGIWAYGEGGYLRSCSEGSWLWTRGPSGVSIREHLLP